MPRRECNDYAGTRPRQGSSILCGPFIMIIVSLIRLSPPPASWGVSINAAAVTNLAKNWSSRDFPPPAFDYPGLPPWKGNRWYDFCVLGCSVIACLWPSDGHQVWETEFEGSWLDDAPGLFACFARQPMLGVEEFRDLSPGAARQFFAGRGTLQLLVERATILRGVAEALVNKWGGHASNLIEAADWDGPRVVDLLVDSVPGYRDEATTELGMLSFNKLAHLCAAMINSRSQRPIARLDTFPVYPDYMLPRILRHNRILRYEDDLGDAVDRRQLIPRGSNWELAIRWSTVFAADRLRAELNRLGNPVETPALDYALWHDAVLGPEAEAMGEHHRTLTLAY